MTEPDQNGNVYQQLTLKAQWLEQKSYAIKTTSNIPENAITTDYQMASEGTLITVTVNKTDGFKWEEKLIFDNSGNKMEVTKTGDNTYTFIMPASDVTIHEDTAGSNDDIEYHTVTFDGNNGLEPEIQKVAHGSVATAFEPPAPDSDSKFVAWYEVLTHGRVARNPFSFKTPINKDITLKAFFADAHGAGEDYRPEHFEGAPIITAEIDYDLMGNYLTQEERDSYCGLLILSSPYVPKADKELAADQIEKLGVTQGEWFYTYLYKANFIHFGALEDLLDREEAEIMTSVSVPIKLTVSIPEELQKTGRTFYLVSYHDGEAAVVAQGADSVLTWEADKFSIYLIAYKDDVDISKASVTLKTTKYTYSGEEKKPDVTVAYNGKELVNNTDYTVQYSNNTAVGTATVTITGKGSCTGMVEKTFTIVPKATTIKTVKAGRKRFTATWKKQMKQTTGYQIQYARNRKFSSGKKTVTIKSNKTALRKITRLKAKKKYYVRIRTYKTVNGKKYYSSWSKVRIAKTK